MSTAPTRSALSPDRPFPGLRPYRFEDHDFFFGREDQIFALYRLLDHSRFVAVVGSSGSGKSSLVRAGLLPLLDKESHEPTGRVWKMIQMHPGDSPVANLAAAMTQQFFAQDEPNIAAAKCERIKYALRRSSFGMSGALKEIESIENASIMLVVDQFEELFRYASKRQGMEADEETQKHEEALQFVQILLAASRDRALNVYVLLTMRSDFIGDCAGFPGLPEAVSASQFLVPSLSRDQREEVIQQPIEKAHATIEPELVQQLLNDSGDDIDQLPVLQHCLLRVWEAAGTVAEGPSPHLTLRHYQDVGGIARALSNHADEIRRELANTGLAVEQLFRAIAEIDSEGRIVRRARVFKDLVAETGVPVEDIRTVIDRLRDDDCSFLIPPRSEVPTLTDDDRVDVGHEALLRRWERVSGDPRSGSQYIGWIRAEVADGRAYRVLLSTAESTVDRIPTDTVEARWKWWNERPRTAAWAERYGSNVDAVERLFRDSLQALHAQRDREQRQAEAEREQERRRIEEATDRRRIELEAAAARDREAAAVHLAQVTRRTMKIVAALLVIALLSGGVAAYQWHDARQETRKATENFNKSISLATAVANKIQELSDNGAISVDAAKQLFLGASEKFPQFEASNKDSEILSSWHAYLIAAANIYMALQDKPKALTFSQQALSIAKRLVAMDPNNEQYQFMLYVAYYNCGDAEDSISRADAMQNYQNALSIAQNMAKNDPTNYAWMQRAAFVMNKIGDLQLPSDQALNTYQAALAINQDIAAKNPKVDDLQRDLAFALERVAGAEAVDKQNQADALVKYNSALAIKKTLADSTPNDASRQSNLASSYNDIAGMLAQQGQFDDASRLYDLALTIRQTLAENDPSNPTLQSNLAYELGYIGDMLAAKRDFTGAADNYRKSLTIRAALASRDPSNVTWSKDLTTSYGNLATALVGQADESLQHGKNAAAIALYQNAQNLVQAFVSSHPGNASLNDTLATITQKIKVLTHNTP
jgi:tetratricopeptide (TPR) repeat protein